MFPYNDDENAWISKNAISINNSIKCNLTTVSPLKYFLRINLI